MANQPRMMVRMLTILAAVILSEPALAGGLLRVHPTNPRYFTDSSGQAIYLAGHQSFVDLQDSTTSPLRIRMPRDRTGSESDATSVRRWHTPSRWISPAPLRVAIWRRHDSVWQKPGSNMSSTSLVTSPSKYPA